MYIKRSGESHILNQLFSINFIVFIIIVIVVVKFTIKQARDKELIGKNMSSSSRRMEIYIYILSVCISHNHKTYTYRHLFVHHLLWPVIFFFIYGNNNNNNREKKKKNRNGNKKRKRGLWQQRLYIYLLGRLKRDHKRGKFSADLWIIHLNAPISLLSLSLLLV